MLLNLYTSVKMNHCMSWCVARWNVRVVWFSPTSLNFMTHFLACWIWMDVVTSMVLCFSVLYIDGWQLPELLKPYIITIVHTYIYMTFWLVDLVSGCNHIVLTVHTWHPLPVWRFGPLDGKVYSQNFGYLAKAFGQKFWGDDPKIGCTGRDAGKLPW